MQAKAMQGVAAATYPPFVIGTFNETLTVRRVGPAPDPGLVSAQTGTPPVSADTNHRRGTGPRPRRKIAQNRYRDLLTRAWLVGYVRECKQPKPPWGNHEAGGSQ